MAWIKADAKAILAIHEHVISNNDRLSVTHSDFNTWTLVIRGVKMEDRGQYMCQVNTDPMKMQVIRATRSNLNDLVHCTWHDHQLDQDGRRGEGKELQGTDNNPFSIFRSFPLVTQTAFLEVVIPPDIVNEETSGDMRLRQVHMQSRWLPEAQDRVAPRGQPGDNCQGNVQGAGQRYRRLPGEGSATIY